ncbi:MAG: hypothetical protein QOI12_1980 [Alphaproteobacteria bacterium]|jgi:hypothetical protein|nr:hypothetical protein [Alphaproteobacteria bacterium]
MWHLPGFDRITADSLALQAQVERAGSAMACAFASSDEFEAAVLRSKRDGVYGRRRLRRHVLHAGAATAALAVLAFLIF